ncbi:Flp pilus assembly complex ATPase component TadA [bacterium]|jgi:general secretion pathway protein E|nr:Flp pilus assembly complex ATPase component TadA [bacterium]
MKSLGEFLVEKKIITQEQLQLSSEEAEKGKESFHEYLLKNKVITDQQLAKALAEYSSFQYVEKITDKMTEPSLLAKTTFKFLRDNAIIPIEQDKQILILTANPLDFQPLDELNIILGGNAVYAVSTRAVIIDGVNRFYPLEETSQMMEELEDEDPETLEFEEIDEKDILGMASEAPIIKLVNHILFQAVKREASDIHIEPQEKEVRVRYRVDGVMYSVLTPPKRVQGALISRIKIMANLNIAEKRKPQDGRIQIKIADRSIDLRVSVLPIIFGESIVMRLFDQTKSIETLKKLGFNKRDYDIVHKSITRPNGIVFTSGPTGSGKTTTLYSILSLLNRPEVNIITVEDPVEYQLAGLSQVAVREKVDLTFANALRSILRQDPDIIMIGETRDQETAQIAIRAALTGHLVLSTIHTNSAAATVTRLIDMGIEPFLVSSSVICIIAQRLVRQLCDKCKKEYKPTSEILKLIGLTEKDVKGATLYKAKGCEECSFSGYKGRLAIFEVMEITEKIAELTIERTDMLSIRKLAIEQGMTTLLQDGIEKVKQGLTTTEEVLTVASSL